jgi:hypothetical protein
MADQLRWFKVWTSAATDADLRALSLENFARWVLFGLYVREHGDQGSLTLSRPAVEVVLRLRIRSRTPQQSRWSCLIKLLKTFPNMTVKGDDDTVTVTFDNWRKYQEETSWQRMREYRQRRNADRNADRNDPRNESDARTRGDGTVTPLPPSSPPPNGTPDPPHAPPPPRFTWPPTADRAATHWRPNDRRPFDALNHDCPDPAWRGTLCVNRAYWDAHPGADLPASSPDAPKQCPYHRALPPPHPTPDPVPPAPPHEAPAW